jgi:hypothetical protein
MTMQSGFVLVARGLFHHPRFKPAGPFTALEAWLWLIESATFAPRDVAVMVGTRRKLVHLEPGQMTHSIRFLARAWRWSPNRVQRFLGDLEMDCSVTTQTDTAQTTITLCNWDKYQKPFSEADTQTDTATDTQTDTKKKEGNKEKKDIARSDELVGFAEWYGSYPRKKQRQAAAKAYRKVIAAKQIEPDLLLARTKAYAAQEERRPAYERCFIPYPASWLNAGGFLDEPEGITGSSTPTPAVLPTEFSTEKWQRCLKLFHERGEWPDSLWGPRPGTPGCLVPPNLLIKTISAAGAA